MVRSRESIQSWEHTKTLMVLYLTGPLSKRPNHGLQPTVTSGLRPLAPAAEPTRYTSETSP
jgi:hypothetical protein